MWKKDFMKRLEIATNAELMVFLDRCREQIRSPMNLVDREMADNARWMKRKIEEEIIARSDVAVLELRRKRLEAEKKEGIPVPFTRSAQ